MHKLKYFSSCAALPVTLFIVLTSSLHVFGQKVSRGSVAGDYEILKQLNAQFIKNFIAQDTTAHNRIIHKDFVCIQSSGEVVNRSVYMQGWAQAYKSNGFTSFDYTDENIRIFGNTALVRSRTIYTRVHNGQSTSGSSVYTDTYIKENGRWWCVQAQITAVK